ncbi:asparagine synthase (glutamine-hydrolyzing) [Clostridium fermenticellae]|uniref:asparagine synthase (glutamine-hydrolyzing) n=1 Tax=Clostridium fermenticellae TaxID=2068654 RepID=A0A386H2Q6_9CLOT|nr:asparagine synthase (glutamine-hydrolyzing) [Clostridium fermenticellae]AYD39934.1 asparagine synthase (glutamine-hydrolyzing) [Clostridium fermenticellae]
MCGIAGIVNFNRNLTDDKNIIESMTDTLKKRGPDSYGYYISHDVLFGHRRLIVVDPEGGVQPMIKFCHNKKYIIVYNGELYNTEEVRKDLLKEGYKFDSYSDTEVLLTSYIHWGEDCVNHINGIFAFAIYCEEDKKVFIARDHLGVKPLFYSIKDGNLIFGSEIKTILAHPIVEPILTEEGLTEIFALGPARNLGSGVLKDIFEVPPANYLIFTKDGVKVKEYWKLKCYPHIETTDETAEHVRNILVDAIKRQLYADVPVCTFLSGGLDSSIISAVAAKEFKARGKVLNTYAIDYEDNELYFKNDGFVITTDSTWAKRVSEFIGSKHHKVLNNNENLAKALKNAVEANDLPGMADIDSSLFLFCRAVRENNVVALSGECADEIFGGYPWFTREEMVNANTFPWSRFVKQRSELLSPQFKSINLQEFVDEKYKENIAKVPYLDTDTRYARRMRELVYLNIKWFMITLLTRKDRMSMANSLEVRVPFADHRLVEYAFNIPPEIRFYGNREKGILRKAAEGMLPKDVIERKKSPYPKTFDPGYTRLVQNWLREILNDKTSPILNIIDLKNVTELMESGGESYKTPWFGQLMKGPQLIAYLIQLNLWLEEYNVKLEM